MEFKYRSKKPVSRKVPQPVPPASRTRDDRVTAAGQIAEVLDDVVRFVEGRDPMAESNDVSLVRKAMKNELILERWRSREPSENLHFQSGWVFGTHRLFSDPISANGGE